MEFAWFSASDLIVEQFIPPMLREDLQITYVGIIIISNSKKFHFEP
jgi:hypothetical protein